MWLYYATKSEAKVFTLPNRKVVMSDYIIEEIEHGVAVLRYPDGSWARVPLSADMTEEDLDEVAWEFKPKVGALPKAFDVKPGQKRTASPAPSRLTEEVLREPTWIDLRLQAYGDIASQIEFITENGLEAWQEHVAEIKKMFPKNT